MNEQPMLTEYGVPIDPQSMVTPPEATELELEPGHPGLGDEGYIERRRELFARQRSRETGVVLVAVGEHVVHVRLGPVLDAPHHCLE